MKPFETEIVALEPVPEAVRTPARDAPAERAPADLRTRIGYWSVGASHTVVDLYPTFILALSVDLQHTLGLSSAQVATIFALNPIFSGLAQPVLAWLSDKLNSRALAPLGLLVGAVCLSCIGYAHSFSQLIALQMLGMAGTGTYHPIAAGLAGETGRHVFRDGGTRRSARAFALSIFFALGMVGGFLGPLSATRINAHLGIRMLPLMAIPGVLGALALWVGTRGVSHRAGRLAARPAATAHGPASGDRARWAAVGVLFLSNSLLFITNIGLYYLYKRWADANIVGTPEVVSSRVGDLIASSQLGMAVGGLALGFLIRPGRERRALLINVLLTAPVILLMPRLPFGGLLAASFVASIGYFSVIPAFLALAQRLLPHATGLVGSLLMGCGWAVSSSAPFLGRWVSERFGLGWAFALFAGTMVAAGLLSLAVPGRLVRESATHA